MHERRCRLPGTIQLLEGWAAGLRLQGAARVDSKGIFRIDRLFRPSGASRRVQARGAKAAGPGLPATPARAEHGQAKERSRFGGRGPREHLEDAPQASIMCCFAGNATRGWPQRVRV